MKVITFKLNEELLEELDSIARLEGTTRSEIIRRAIQLYIRLRKKRYSPKPKIVKLKS